MPNPVIVNFADLSWQDHSTIAGIQIKMMQHAPAYPPDDFLVARVARGGEIPRHVHEHQSELAYVLQGIGTLYCAEDQDTEPTNGYPLSPSTAFVVPPGAWHRVENTGADEMLIFAAHAAG